MQISLPNTTTINLWKLAVEGGCGAGKLSLQEMPRLGMLLSACDGFVDVCLQAGVDEQGVHYIEGQLAANLEVACQRCMEPMAVPLEVDFRLGLIKSEEQAAALAEVYEPLVAIENETSIYDVIEDELILALPFAPMCDDPKQCQHYFPVTSGPAMDKPNPFAALATLLKDSKTEE